MNGKFVLVTTKHRGIFAGTLVGDASSEELVLHNARNCIYWRNGKGFLGLASDGPDETCKIGSAVEGNLKLYDITSIAECSEGAEKAWKSAS